ncbi:MAG: hypothetical protein K5842_04115 [Bacteroidales bacterium]|nr:hypothetical protein [Bacteroidales bacterium]
MDIDIKELIKAAAEGFDLSNFKGDVVGVKVVENEIGNVEAGGIGVQKVYNGTDVQNADECQQATRQQPATINQECNDELFHFIHPELDDEEAWRIHDAVKRVVRLQGIQMICQYLVQLKNENKVLLPPIPSAAYTELVRMGMPDGDGFNETTFRKYYNRPIAPNAK